ncbi:enoyl-CoA hydratase-related protein [Stutzerimonas stutzeri]|uniref:enoyl-CoA hydratase-related protein n=1 Tax=Stutzerimonas stutzeri TaxID=316 RepID=UPI0036DDD6B2
MKKLQRGSNAMSSVILSDTLSELARRFYRGLAKGDRDELDALLHPAFVGITTRCLPMGLGGTYQGPEQMRRHFWGGLAKHFQAKADIASISLLAEDRLQVEGVYLGKGTLSGATLDARFIHLLRFQDGRLIELEQLTDSAAWQAALQPEPTVVVTIDNGIAWVRLDRPADNNAINQQMADELLLAARQCAADATVRVVVLEGAGRAFTVGGDLHFLADVEAETLPGKLAEMLGNYHEALRIFNRLSVPVIAAVQGPCAGGGLGLMYCADLVLAADNCRFALGFATLGFSPDGGNSWFLPRLIGPRRAAELYFEGRVLSAEEAKDWGLVNRVVALDQLHAEVMACAERMTRGVAAGFAAARQLLRQSWDKSLSEQLEAETDAMVRLAEEPAVSQALKRFVDNKKPAK